MFLCFFFFSSLAPLQPSSRRARTISSRAGRRLHTPHFPSVLVSCSRVDIVVRLPTPVVSGYLDDVSHFSSTLSSSRAEHSPSFVCFAFPFLPCPALPCLALPCLALPCPRGHVPHCGVVDSSPPRSIAGVTPGHSNRVFSLKFDPDNDNVIVTGGWDNTVQIWDARAGHAVRSFYGPHVCGDSVDVFDGMVLTGSWRPENPLEVRCGGCGC